MARFDNLTGAWLLLAPCWMGLALAGGLNPWLYALLFAGAFIMRGAGCIINDIVDREFDAKVERTKNRPLASGEISLERGIIFLAVLLALGLAILVQLPIISVFIGISSVPLFILYPFMKRVTHWPQFFLGLTFNIGILIGYAAVANSISFSAALLYIGAIFWTLGYDTIYAHQDKQDDVLIGVKSTALKFGERTKHFIAMFYLIFAAIFVIVIGMNFGFGLKSGGVFCLVLLHLAWQVLHLDIHNPRNCMTIFKSNIYVGLLLVAVLLLSATGH